MINPAYELLAYGPDGCRARRAGTRTATRPSPPGRPGDMSQAPPGGHDRAAAGASSSGRPAGHNHQHAHGGTVTGRHRRALTIVLSISIAIAVAEVVGAVLTGSLVLFADAAHMAADAAGVGLSLLAAWFASRPASGRRTFGYARAEILAAMANSLLLLAMAGVIFYEAIRRLMSPPAVSSGLLIAFGAGALVANACSLLVLRQRPGREPQCPGRVPGSRRRHARRSRGHRHRHHHRDDRLHAGRSDRLAGRRRADPAADLAAAQGGDRHPARGQPGEHRPRTSSASTWPPSPASARCTTCTSGQSPRACRSSPRTSW